VNERSGKITAAKMSNTFSEDGFSYKTPALFFFSECYRRHFTLGDFLMPPFQRRIEREKEQLVKGKSLAKMSLVT
jgi:hypothetical protein